MRHIDLDALRAERAKGRGKPPTVKLAGKKFTLPAELPCSALEAIANDDTTAFGKALLGTGWERFCKVGGTKEDLLTMGNQLGTLYGVNGTGPSPSAPDERANGDG